jgi:hypothetical protein
MRFFLQCLLLHTFAIFAFNLICVEARAEIIEPVQEANGVRVYAGVIPTPIATAHPLDHAESGMHSGQRSGNMHLVIALYDEKGIRIENASVTARILGAGHSSEQTVKLEPMKINDTITFGAFVHLEKIGRQTIAVEVQRERERAILVNFFYEPR